MHRRQPAPDSPPSQLAYSMPEAARALGIGVSTLYLLIARGEIQTFTIGRRRVVSARAIERFIQRREAETSR